MTAALLLIDPKFPHNVGGALRAAACFGAGRLSWTGDRVPDPALWPDGARLPREERLKAYHSVVMTGGQDENEVVSRMSRAGLVPVCVELNPNAESLPEFVHPENALYVFGPEDGEVPKGIRHVCHRFVRIPSVGPLNLAAATNVVLYDRLVKQTQGKEEVPK